MSILSSPAWPIAVRSARKLRAALAAAAVVMGALLALPAAAETRFTPGPCWFTVPDGEAALCGTVAVPERRDRANSRSLRLPVAVLLSTARQPDPDPLLFLEGGPGASPFGSGEATEERMEVWWELSAPFRRTRNLILFDPRGVGRAEPDTDCPELDAVGGIGFSGSVLDALGAGAGTTFPQLAATMPSAAVPELTFAVFASDAAIGSVQSPATTLGSVCATGVCLTSAYYFSGSGGSASVAYDGGSQTTWAGVVGAVYADDIFGNGFN